MNGTPLKMDDLLATLRCPYCGATLSGVGALSSDGLGTFGLLRCGCGPVPVMGGAVCIGGFGRWRGEAIECLGDGRHRDAIIAAMLESGRSVVRRFASAIRSSGLPTPGAAHRVGADAIARLVDPDGGVGFRHALRMLRGNKYADYLYYRYANPSFLASIPALHLLSNIDDGGLRVVDIAGGCGHAAALMAQICPTADIVLTDHDFCNLFLARRYVAPDALLVCLDAEAPLPFVDGVFDVAVCSDALHYVRSKAALVREIARITTPSGAWVMPHLHNADAYNPTPGMPLTGAGYTTLLPTRRRRLVDEAELLARYRLDLCCDPDDSALEPTADTAAFTLLACDDARFWSPVEIGPQIDNAHLGLNPIYQRNGSSADLKWPSEHFRLECASTSDLLRDRIDLDGAREDLIKTGALVPMSRAYREERK